MIQLHNTYIDMVIKLRYIVNFIKSSNISWCLKIPKIGDTYLITTLCQHAARKISSRYPGFVKDQREGKIKAFSFFG